MKKLLIIALLALAVMLTMVACNTGDDPANDDTSTDSVAAESSFETDSENGTDESAETQSDSESVTDSETETETETESETETEDPYAPTEFYSADWLVGMDNINPNEGTNEPVLDPTGTYVTITPLTNDYYYYPLGSYFDGDRYVSIKYRTDNADGMSMQIYIGSDTIHNDNDMLKLPVEADGEWHLAVFDAMLVNDQEIDITGQTGTPGYYDGSFVSFFRFDPLDCDYILNDEGMAWKDENDVWVRWDKPEGAYIDVEYIAFFDSMEKAYLYEGFEVPEE